MEYIYKEVNFSKYCPFPMTRGFGLENAVILQKELILIPGSEESYYLVEFIRDGRAEK